MTLQQIIELGKRATPGPWTSYGPFQIPVTFDHESSVGPTGDYSGPIAVVSGDDDEHSLIQADFIRAACNAAPVMAERLLGFRELLKLPCAAIDDIGRRDDDDSTLTLSVAEARELLALLDEDAQCKT